MNWKISNGGEKIKNRGSFFCEMDGIEKKLV